MRRNIYLASSWRNPYQPELIRILREGGHDVYDFRNPAPGKNGFAWSEIDPYWKTWTSTGFRSCLSHPRAEEGYGLDWGAMNWADTGVLLLPSGRSAHIEAGYFVGAKKQLFILLADGGEPELMYKMATALCVGPSELIEALR
jgi:hypothetical protein